MLYSEFYGFVSYWGLFELVFVKGVRSVSRLFFCLGCSVVPVSLVENLKQNKTVFSPLFYLCFFFFLVKHRLTVFKWVCVWAFYSISFMYMSVPLPVPHCFGYCNFMVSLEVTYISPPTLFNIVLAILGLLPLHKHFRINWSIYRKITCGDFVWGSIMNL